MDKKMSAESEQRCMNIALAGLPNAGKSTLFNRIIGDKVSIVSPREQTTRDVIRGVMLEGSSQLIFVDTPGLFRPQKSRILERTIARNAWKGIENIDLLCLIIDSSRKINDELTSVIKSVATRQENMVFVLNKVDLVRKEKLLEMARELSDLYPKFMEIFMLSALSGENIDKFKKYLLSLAPMRPWLFEADDMTDAPAKFMATEITREKLFLTLKQDLPYSLEVLSDSFENLNNGDLKIHQTIAVLKESQKAIVVGKSGLMLKNTGILARRDMEQLFGKKVHLFLFVKVKPDWIEEKFRSRYSGLSEN
ncbi:MAG: GTPase Era [Rickettsiales bacterium]|jgi:GTP-binding protein Era|nr:GTPase Era [Rickettsiales bacterium]